MRLMIDQLKKNICFRYVLGGKNKKASYFYKAFSTQGGNRTHTPEGTGF